MTMTPPRILIAGIGNIFLGDDGFGSEVARLLSQHPTQSGVHVKDFGIRGLDLAYALLEDFDAVVLVDTTQRGGPPGTLYVIEPEPEPDGVAAPRASTRTVWILQKFFASQPPWETCRSVFLWSDASPQPSAATWTP